MHQNPAVQFVLMKYWFTQPQDILFQFNVFSKAPNENGNESIYPENSPESPILIGSQEGGSHPMPPVTTPGQVQVSVVHSYSWVSQSRKCTTWSCL